MGSNIDVDDDYGGDGWYMGCTLKRENVVGGNLVMDDWFISSVSLASLIRETGRQAKASKHSPKY